MPKAALTPRMISDFCRLRLADVLEESERTAVCRYLTDLLELLAFPPYRGRWIDWAEVAIVAGIEKERLQGARHRLQPVFDAVSRAVALQDVAPALRTPPKDIVSADRPAVQSGRSRRTKSSPVEATTRRKRGPKPKVIVEYPEPLWTEWEEPETLSEALNLHMRRHGDSVRHLFLALDAKGDAREAATPRWIHPQVETLRPKC